MQFFNQMQILEKIERYKKLRKIKKLQEKISKAVDELEVKYEFFIPFRYDHLKEHIIDDFRFQIFHGTLSHLAEGLQPKNWWTEIYSHEGKYILKFIAVSNFRNYKKWPDLSEALSLLEERNKEILPRQFNMLYINYDEDIEEFFKFELLTY